MPQPLTGSTADPEFRRARAVRAGKASQTLDAYITRLVNAAPRLTDEQKSRLATALRGESS